MQKEVQPAFILGVEKDELFIQAGLQDRVIQVLWNIMLIQMTCTYFLNVWRQYYSEGSSEVVSMMATGASWDKKHRLFCRFMKAWFTWISANICLKHRVTVITCLIYSRSKCKYFLTMNIGGASGQNFWLKMEHLQKSGFPVPVGLVANYFSRTFLRMKRFMYGCHCRQLSATPSRKLTSVLGGLSRRPFRLGKNPQWRQCAMAQGGTWHYQWDEEIRRVNGPGKVIYVTFNIGTSL